jgi:hypothetical protein
VAVTMDQDPSHNYWVSVHSQYRSASPSAYAVLRYVGTTGDPALPPSPTPLGTVEPWDDVMTSYVSVCVGMLLMIMIGAPNLSVLPFCSRRSKSCWRRSSY